MTKAYTEAVRHQPSGCFLVPCATFISVARNFGFDRWKVRALQPALQEPRCGGRARCAHLHACVLHFAPDPQHPKQQWCAGEGAGQRRSQ